MPAKLSRVHSQEALPLDNPPPQPQSSRRQYPPRKPDLKVQNPQLLQELLQQPLVLLPEPRQLQSS